MKNILCPLGSQGKKYCCFLSADVKPSSCSFWGEPEPVDKEGATMGGGVTKEAGSSPSKVFGPQTLKEELAFL